MRRDLLLTIAGLLLVSAILIGTLVLSTMSVRADNAAYVEMHGHPADWRHTVLPCGTFAQAPDSKCHYVCATDEQLGQQYGRLECP